MSGIDCGGAERRYRKHTSVSGAGLKKILGGGAVDDAIVATAQKKGVEAKTKSSTRIFSRIINLYVF